MHSDRLIKVWVDVGPQHFLPGAAPPKILKDVPDFRQKKGEYRIVAEVLLRDEGLLSGLGTSLNGEMERVKSELFGGTHGPRRRHLKNPRIPEHE